MSQIKEEVKKNRINSLMSKIAEERVIRFAARKNVIDQNRVKNDMVVCKSRSDEHDTQTIDTWSPEYNAAFRELPQIHGDRDPTRQRIWSLTERIDRARKAFDWTDVFCLEDGITYRTNGNTSSWIATEFPELFKNAKVFRTHCIAETYKEVELIHTQHDSPISNRTPAEVLKVWTTSFGIQLQDKIVNPLLGAIEMAFVAHKNRVQGADTLDNKLDSITYNVEFYHWFHDNIAETSTKTNGTFLRVCFLTFIYLLYQIKTHKTQVVEFLQRTIYTERFSSEQGDPCRALHDWMLRTEAPKSDDDTPEFMRQVGKAIIAWNAFVTGRKIRSQEIGGLHNNKPLPHIEGMDKQEENKYAILTKIYISPEKRQELKKKGEDTTTTNPADNPAE